MSVDNSDMHLESLRNASMEGSKLGLNVNKSSKSITRSNSKKGKTKKRNKPNTRNANRISARRIGGPNYQMDLEALRLMKAKANKGKPSLSRNASTGSTFGQPVTPAVPVPTMMNVAAAGPVPMSMSAKKPMPRVQELGRRSSSKPAINMKDRARSNSTFSNTSAPTTEVIIRYGELKKKAVVTKTWNNRFFIMTDKHLFYYAEPFDVPQEMSQIKEPPKGKIDLTQIEEVVKNKENPCCFTIHVNTRIFELKLDDDIKEGVNFAKLGAEAWVSAILGATENAKQHILGQAGRGSFTNYKVDEMDSAIRSASTYKHPTKRLIGSQRFSISRQPHQPASLTEYDEWTPFDVSAWLYTVKLQHYSEAFYRQGVDGKALKELTKKDDLEKLGVEEEDQMDMLNAIEELRQFDEVAIE